MATAADLLVDAFGRIKESVHDALHGLTGEQLATPVAREANTVAWLVWHLTRIMDDHVAGVSDGVQVWTRDGWADRFALPFPDAATGYGHTSEEVGQVKVGGELLAGYHDATHARAVEFAAGVTEAGLDRIVDTSWDPPVTLAVRLVSVVNDSMQHAGQAAYVRGILLRRA